MIIPCKQCHTRFKVPDGKVTARGLKVRCSRCGHTFRIYPESESERGADPAPAAARPRGPDPFEIFGPEGTSEMEKTPARGATVSALLAQMEPASAEEDFEVDIAGVDSPSTEPAWNFPPAPARPGPAAAAAVAIQVEPPSTLPEPAVDWAPLPVRPVSPAPEPERPSQALANLFEEQPEDAPDDLEQTAKDLPTSPPASADEPRGEDLVALAGFTPAWGVAGPSRALSMDGTLSSHVSSLAAVPEAEPPPPPPPQFGGVGTVLDDLPSLDPAGLPALGELELDAGSDAAEWSGAEPTGHGGQQLELGPDLPSMELDRRPPPEPVPSPPADLSWSLPAAPPAAPPPVAATAALGWDDPFSEPPPPPPPRSPPPPVPEPVAALPRTPAPNAVMLDEAPPPGPSAPDHGFFEMSAGPSLPVIAGPEPSGALLPDIPETPEPAAAAISPVTSGPFPAISKPPGRTRLGLQERELPGTARRVSAVILNVGLAALLLLVTVGVVSSWATAGRVDGSALSPRRLFQALRSGSGVTPVEVTPGTYETRSGRSLLYVRGKVLNRGAPSARVRVRAEVWDGAQAVKTGETLAGAIATPEELWRAATPADVEALRARLLGAASPVADGQQADFLVLLDEAPRDLSGLRLKIIASVDR